MRHSKRTITIQSRITRFTRTWWANLTFTVLFVFLLFTSCEDPDSVLGFKDGKDRFQVRFVEIPLGSSVVLTDSIRTQNLGGEENRVLTGRYQDPVFGKVYAEAIFQIIPASIYITIPATAVLDSSFLTVRSDFFQYGNAGVSTEEFNLHEVTETLKYEGSLYYAKTPTSYTTQAISTASISVDPATFKKEFDDADTDPTVNLKFPLSADYAQRLFKVVNKDDASFTEFKQFRENFKGLAIVPSNGNKILGFDLNSSKSFITLYYHEGDVKSTFTYNLNAAVNYSHLSFDRSGSDFSALTEYYKEYNPNGGKRAIQSGSGIITKLDFKNFFNYTDTIPNLIFNSAEIIVSNVDAVGEYYAPTLALALTRDNNKLFSIRNTNKADSTKDTNDFFAFNGRLLGSSSVFIAGGDDSNPVGLSYNSETKAYSAFCTLFMQQLYTLQKKDQLFPYFSLYPVNPFVNKSVNRASFNADQIKLRLYFTRPLTNN